MKVETEAAWISPCTVLVGRDSACTPPDTCCADVESATRFAKLVSVRLKPVVWEFAMLPEIFWRAKDCACKPPTAVVNALKIPMALLHLGALRQSGARRRRHHRKPCATRRKRQGIEMHRFLQFAE